MDLKDYVSIVSAIVGISGLFFGLYQYYKAQKWKRSEFAANLLQQLSTDPDLSMCCTFLDWSARAMAVPERYQVFTQEKSFTHNWTALAEAMEPETDKANFEFPLVLYRDVFDIFFTYLDRVNHYISIGLFTETDVKSLVYWLNQIKNPRFAFDPNTGALIDPFERFIKAYDYKAVTDLITRFEKKGLMR